MSVTPTGAGTAGEVVVGVPTYRRPGQLAALLAVLADQVAHLGRPARIAVVDNDPATSARPAVEALATVGVTYHVEARPGVAAARNRLLDVAGDAAALVFIDDDQMPCPGWLEALVDAWTRWGCAAVAGPVRWELPEPTDPWVVASGRFARRDRPTGSFRPGAGTGNLLVDLDLVRAAGLRFDDRYGLSGGEDTLFTRAMVAAGGRIRWCDTAEVAEAVPPSRATRRWVLDREVRSGSVWARVQLDLAAGRGARWRTHAVLAVRAAWRAVRGTAQRARGRATGRLELVAAAERDVASAVGLLRGLRGAVIEEYARSPAPSRPDGRRPGGS